MINKFEGQKVFVTGADGFIGSHLVESLVSSGANVRALTYYNSWNEKGWLKNLSPSVRSSVELFNGDVRDIERIQEGVSKCDIIFHLSSLIAIPYSYNAPRSYIDTNITGTLNVLQSCLKNTNLTRILHVSTSEVYGSAQYIPISESHPLVAQSPYSASKIAADKIAESFHLSFGLPIVTARPFNTFGPRQTARAVIPTIASQMLAGLKKIKLGLLSPTRDFNYVVDTVEAMKALALCSKAEGEVVNIGTGQEWSISETFNLLSKLIGSNAEIEMNSDRLRPAKSEVNRLVADVSKLYSLTGWKSKYTFIEGLQATCNWISQNMKYFDVADYSK